MDLCLVDIRLPFAKIADGSGKSANTGNAKRGRMRLSAAACVLVYPHG